MKDDLQKTLVILSPGFPADESDSTCIPPQQVFVAALKKFYPSLNLVVLAFQYPFVSAEYEWKRMKVIALAGRNKGNVNRVLIWWKAWRILRKLKAEYDLLGILSFWCGEAALVGSAFAKRNHLKHFCWILGQDAQANNRMVNWISPKEVELIALSDLLQQQFQIHHGTRPAHVIPCAIDPALFNKNTGKRNIDLLGVGSLIPLKQFDLFVEIIAEVKKKFPSIRTMICGKGPEEQRLTEMINQLGLNENILLAGEKSHDEVLCLMQQTKIFIHTSSYEGFGAVCIEALYGGAQVVSFIKPMNAHIPHWHVVQSKEEMVKKILLLLVDPAVPHNPVLPFSVKSTTKSMMKLFDYEETNT
jgi:glycosyltransferase involved in cell wall biosynthesis